MAVYQLVDQMSRDPETRDKWIIERAVPGGPPIRLLFQGSRRARAVRSFAAEWFPQIKNRRVRATRR